MDCAIEDYISLGDRKDRALITRMGQIKRLERFMEKSHKSIAMPSSVTSIRPSFEDFRRDGIGLSMAESNIMKLFQRRDHSYDDSMTASSLQGQTNSQPISAVGSGNNNNNHSIMNTSSIKGASVGIPGVKAPSSVPPSAMATSSNSRQQVINDHDAILDIKMKDHSIDAFRENLHINRRLGKPMDNTLYLHPLQNATPLDIVLAPTSTSQIYNKVNSEITIEYPIKSNHSNLNRPLKRTKEQLKSDTKKRALDRPLGISLYSMPEQLDDSVTASMQFVNSGKSPYIPVSISMSKKPFSFRREKSIEAEPWSSEEDAYIMELSKKFGTNSWWIMEKSFMAHFAGKWRARSARQIKERYHRLSSSSGNVSSPLHSPKSISLSQHQLADSIQNRMKEILRLAAPSASLSNEQENDTEKISISNRSSGDASDNLMIMPSLDVMDFDELGLFGVGEETIPMDIHEPELSQTQDSLVSSQMIPSSITSQTPDVECVQNISAEDSARDQFSSQFAHLSPIQVLMNIQQDTSPSEVAPTATTNSGQGAATSVPNNQSSGY